MITYQQHKKRRDRRENKAVEKAYRDGKSLEDITTEMHKYIYRCRNTRNTQRFSRYYKRFLLLSWVAAKMGYDASRFNG